MMNNYIQNVEAFASFLQESGMGYEQARDQMSQLAGRQLTDMEFDNVIKDGSWQQLAQPSEKPSAEQEFRDVTGGLLELSGVMQPSEQIPAQPVPQPRGMGQFEDPNMIDPGMMPDIMGGGLTEPQLSEPQLTEPNLAPRY